MKRNVRKFDPFGKRTLNPIDRYCDHPECRLAGDHKAPQSRKLNEYYYFCADHAKEYNRAWNYYEGMSESEIEDHIRTDTCWQRPTWPLGERMAGLAGFDPKKTKDTFKIFDDEPAGTQQPPHEQTKTRKAPEAKAMAIMELEDPLTLEALKVRYKALVKLHHPDKHGGDKTAEEKFKAINQAYTILKDSLDNHD